MGEVFKDKYIVSYYDVDIKERIKADTLVGLLPMFANNHSYKLGYTLEWFSQENKAWVLLNWHIKIHKLPTRDQLINCTTWSRPFKRAQADRSFVLADENGTPLVEALSRWVLLDRSSRRPTKLPDDMMHNYSVDAPLVFTSEDYIQETPSVDFLQKVTPFTAQRSHTDNNSHVNNVTYLTWALDSTPNHIFDNIKLSDIRVSYKKESHMGSLISEYFYLKKLPDASWQATSIFKSTENLDIIHCHVTTVWR